MDKAKNFVNQNTVCDTTDKDKEKDKQKIPTDDIWQDTSTQDTVTLDEITPTTPPITDIEQYLNDTVKIDMNTAKIRPDNSQPSIMTDVTKDSLHTDDQIHDKLTNTSQDRCITYNTNEENSEKEEIMQVKSYELPTKVKTTSDSTRAAKKGRTKRRIGKKSKKQVSTHKITQIKQDTGSPAVLRMEDIPITTVPMPSAYKFLFEKLNIKTEKLSKFKMTTFWPRAERQINCKNKLKFVNTSSEIADSSDCKKDCGGANPQAMQLENDEGQHPKTDEKLEASDPNYKQLEKPSIPEPIPLLPIIPPITITNPNRMLIPTSINIQYPIIVKNINTNK